MIYLQQDFDLYPTRHSTRVWPMPKANRKASTPRPT